MKGTNIDNILDAIRAERVYQNERWGEEFDKLNTPNDWIAYITNYAGKAVTMPYRDFDFRTNLLKIATLCVAALERSNYAPRHYD